MIQLSFEEDKAILKFPKELVGMDYVQEFLERLKMELIIEKSKLTEEQAIELAEEIKQKWWERNKQRFLEKNND